MEPLTLFLIAMGVKLVSAVITGIVGEMNKNQAKADADKISSDLDTLLGTETGKLTTEYNAQTDRLGSYKDAVLGSERAGFAVRGDFGGAETAAAQVLQSTENQATKDQGLLDAQYQAGKDTLAQQTQLAKDQLNSNLDQYLNSVTASQINAITGVVDSAITGFSKLDLTPPTLMDSPDLGGGGGGNMAALRWY